MPLPSLLLKEHPNLFQNYQQPEVTLQEPLSLLHHTYGSALLHFSFWHSQILPSNADIYLSSLLLFLHSFLIRFQERLQTSFSFSSWFLLFLEFPFLPPSLFLLESLPSPLLRYFRRILSFLLPLKYHLSMIYY